MRRPNPFDLLAGRGLMPRGGLSEPGASTSTRGMLFPTTEEIADLARLKMRQAENAPKEEEKKEQRDE